MPEPKTAPTVVIFITPVGVVEVQVVSPTRRQEPEGQALYQRVRPLVDRIDRLVRGGAR